MDTQNMSQSEGFDIYDFINGRYEPDEDSGTFRCKRCGEVVSWVTKHAAEKHGDDVEVRPVQNDRIEVRW